MPKRNILLIPGYRLFPIDTGAGVAQYGIIDELRKHWSVSLLIDNTNCSSKAESELKSRWPQVEFIRWDTIKQSWERAMSKSLTYRIKRKLGLGSQSYAELKAEVPEALTEIWKNLSILYYPTPEWRTASLKHYLESQEYDLVQTDLPCHLPLAESVPKKSLSVHVCHELKFKRLESSAEMLELNASDYLDFSSEIRLREIALLNAYDLRLCYSEADQQAITKAGGKSVQVSPYPMLDSEFYMGERKEPQRLIFLGAEHHGPNREGLVWFLKKIWPQVDTNMKLHVIGKWSETSIQDLQSEQVIFEGFVQNLAPYFQDSIMIVPVLSGAGIRTKILQAMAQRVPVLSTAFAAEGISVIEARELQFFENSEEFQAKLDKLNDSDFRKEMLIQAQEFVTDQFGQKSLGQQRMNLLDQLLRSVQRS